jgi:hypothetical protein
MDSRADFSNVCDFVEKAGAGGVFYHGTTLLIHLRNVWRILSNWECPPEVCSAGLCHSVYSSGDGVWRRGSAIGEKRSCTGCGLLPRERSTGC